MGSVVHRTLSALVFILYAPVFALLVGVVLDKSFSSLPEVRALIVSIRPAVEASLSLGTFHSGHRMGRFRRVVTVNP